jgi:hypothetical protein
MTHILALKDHSWEEEKKETVLPWDLYPKVEPKPVQEAPIRAKCGDCPPRARFCECVPDQVSGPWDSTDPEEKKKQEEMLAELNRMLYDDDNDSVRNK